MKRRETQLKQCVNPLCSVYLCSLVGKVNVVYTGVVIKYGETICRFTEKANVHFGEATPEQIKAYVDTGEPL